MAWKSFKMNGTRWAIERKHFLEYLLRKNASRSATFFVQSGLGTKFFLFVLSYPIWLGFSSGSAVKNSPAMREMQVRSLGGEDPLEEGMATDSGMLAGRIPRREERGGLRSRGSRRVRLDWSNSSRSTTLSCYPTGILILILLFGWFCPLLLIETRIGRFWINNLLAEQMNV